MKFFEIIQYLELMHLKPYNPSKTTCQTLKRIDETYITEHFSNFIAGLCFDIQLNDKTMLVFIVIYH